MNRNIKIGIIIAVCLVVGIGAYSLYASSKSRPHFVIYKDNYLTDAQKKIFQDRINTIQTQLKSATSDDKYNLYMNEGFNYYGLGMLDKASDAFNNAIKVKSTDFTAYTGLFQVQVDMGDYQGALASIKKAIDMNSTIADTWLKYITLEKNQLAASNDQVNDLYVQALNKTSNHIDVVTSYAQFLETVGNLEAAKEYWQKAIAINPASKKTYQAQVDRLSKLIGPQ